MNIRDNLLLADRYGIRVICQQTNCLTVRPYGLSQQIAVNLGIDPYSKRRPIGNRNCAIPEDRETPGTIDFMMSNKSPLIVANLYAQYGPGKPGKYTEDSFENRQKWFEICMRKLHNWAVENKIDKIGLPYLIGCGLAGGNWEIYSSIIANELPEAVIFFFSN